MYWFRTTPKPSICVILYIRYYIIAKCSVGINIKFREKFCIDKCIFYEVHTHLNQMKSSEITKKVVSESKKILKYKT